jgi:hypothetical protein
MIGKIPQKQLPVAPVLARAPGAAANLNIPKI